jgi:hypothetical protein
MANFLAMTTLIAIGGGGAFFGVCLGGEVVEAASVARDDATECVVYGCKRVVGLPVYSPAANNCGQYVSEGALKGDDGACDCDGTVCFVDDSDCTGSIDYTITPADADTQVCHWTNYPATPATYGGQGYGAATTVTCSVITCGDIDEQRAYLSSRPDTGPQNCNDNMFTSCTMTFKLECTACSDYVCP